MSVAHEGGGEGGFTLLELLVSVTLLALLSLVLVASLRIGTHIWNKAENTSTSENTIRAAQRLLAQDLDRLYPRFVSPSATEGFVDFDGSANRLAFLSIAGQESGLIKRVTVSAAPDGADFALRYTAAIDLAPSLVMDSKPLLHHLASLNFSYFGADDGAQLPVWHNTWQHRRSAPLLIRIRVVTRGAESGTWPELVIRPRIAADVGCTFDPLSKFCLGR